MTMLHPRGLLYDFPALAQEDFLNADRLVRAVMIAGGVKLNWRKPRRVTSDITKLSWIDERRYIQKDIDRKRTPEAVCFQDKHFAEEFNIWFNPKSDTTSELFHWTLVHELCHGYVGPPKGHNHVWKNLCSRSLHHYHWLVKSLNGLDGMVHHNFHHYSKRSKSETEFDRDDRIRKECDSVSETAVNELTRVMDIFERLENRVI